MSLKDLTKNTFILASPKFVQFFIRIVRAKINAILIGTEGVGIVNQLQSVNNKLGGFSTLSLNVGAKKLIVSNNNEENKDSIPHIITLFTILIIGLTFITYILGFIFYEKIGDFFLGEEATKYFLIVFIFFPLIPLTTISRTVLGSLQRFKYLAKGELITIIIAFITYLPLIYYLGIQGAVINISITICLGLIVLSYFGFIKTAKKLNMKLFALKGFKIRKKHLKELGSISGISSILGIYGVVVELVIRGLIVNSMGIQSIGIYTPIIAWSGFFSSLFLPSLFEYIFPKYGMCKTNEEIINVANNAFRLLTFLIIPFILFIIPLKKILLLLLYSEDFLEASIYLPLHFIGILFWTWMRILKQIFVPTGKIKTLIPFAFAEETLYLLVILLFIDKIGLWAWAMRFSIIPLILFLAFIIFLVKEINFKIKKENYLLMIYGVATCFLISIISDITVYSFIPSIVFILSLYFFTKATERKELKQMVYKLTRLK